MKPCKLYSQRIITLIHIYNVEWPKFIKNINNKNKKYNNDNNKNDNNNNNFYYYYNNNYYYYYYYYYVHHDCDVKEVLCCYFSHTVV